ncbi:conserved protein, unknown function [Plasmodium knowlesi strain H]|uniref:Cilia- and flagella-associated protein 299 n=3 Tax=Plasmodium knowlesi TaxID=5850 RepID=A0A5K1UYD8_PLAKH|nr:conserved protein, unknown function [Plasmodium knowlesi strain H]OTN67539.1 Uncharacterized protein PKNOH_S06432400 [Plasmodium knowlesi]CAA9987594.1 conserved protein, unknown function [Plasmodium knowlesi strain H]SBO27010.1 conserved protein, unknown function [Plasmodium knowlesi strain H]SBO29231.1 conserved protein, unknown function [Plasmodium knowlesi strain H]VVS77068.1 conserved protein, unknown function [Plasmodium knowlesi strain H]|eukprot:XP_002258596.1 hypothetical protein, conserved in Plasmodium species [Plasmodium knowlesi strain H]
MEGEGDCILTFSSYEEYVKSKITPADLFYIEDEQLVFEIFSLGLQSRGVLSCEDFNSTYQKNKKKNESLKRAEERKEDIVQYDINSLTDHTMSFFYAINCHMHFCESNKICSILFIRYVNKNNSEISSYIDINSEKIRQKIKQQKYIYARKDDLAYFNWHNNYSCTNDSENFQIIVNKQVGILFKYKRGGKYFTLNPVRRGMKIRLSDNISEGRASAGLSLGEEEKMISLCDGVERVELRDENYLQCILYTLRV